MRRSTTLKTCKRCVFWEAGEREHGVCRMNSPQPIRTMRPVIGAPVYTVLWPQTRESDWCASFEAKWDAGEEPSR